MDVKDKIERIMFDEKLNSSQFAIEIGIQNSTLSHILNGRNKPSLDVLTRILNRFRTISSDWLILDVGAMYRSERNSQALTLFDNVDENSLNTVSYEDKIPQKLQSEVLSNNKQYAETPSISNEQDNSTINQISVSKGINKIIVYYTDNTFEEFRAK